MKQLKLILGTLIVLILSVVSNITISYANNNTLLPYCDYDIGIPDEVVLSTIVEYNKYKYYNNKLKKEYILLKKISNLLDNKLDIKNNINKILYYLCLNKINDKSFFIEYNNFIKDYQNYEIQKEKLTKIWTIFMNDYYNYLTNKNKNNYNKTIADLKLFVKLYKQLNKKSNNFKNLKVMKILKVNKYTITSKDLNNINYQIKNLVIEDIKGNKYNFNYYNFIYNSYKHKNFIVGKPFIIIYNGSVKKINKIYYLLNTK